MLNMFYIFYNSLVLFVQSSFFDYLITVFCFLFLVTIFCLIHWFFTGD